MTPEQFKTEVIEPTLKIMGQGMYSEDAVRLLYGTAIHESDGFKRITQYSGPALSYYQIEPATLHDLYENYLKFRPELLNMLDRFKGSALSQDDALRMNMAYATAAARLHYYRVKDKLPENVQEDAHYWKKYYNTLYGKGTVEKYLDDVKGLI